MSPPAEDRTDRTPPLLRLRGVTRTFPAGDGVVAVLQDIDLTIRAGEMVAIIGPSGSGKSTLMNIIGCLDRPTQGSYQVLGRETGRMAPDELAQLRREHFGFVFQRYQLLGGLTARENVEVPSLYAGVLPRQRHARAEALLARLGLAERTGHRPGQLSGGQQQRVSIARALMNGGDVVLADEPTGALDRATGEEVMRILQELHAAGHTIILVTHDAKVAAHAQRVIEISDGHITRDTAQVEPAAGPGAAHQAPQRAVARGGMRGALSGLQEATRMAWHAMGAHRMRTLLTMLGIIIGITSVVLVNAIGEGAKQQILSDIAALGTNTIDVMPGHGPGDRNADRIRTLNVADAKALEALPALEAVSPEVRAQAPLRRGSVDRSGSIVGVSETYFRVRGLGFARGVPFSAESVQDAAPEAVIDDAVAGALFRDEDPIGRTLLVGRVPVRVVGVTERRKGSWGMEGATVWLPYSTVMVRLSGSQQVQSITIRVADRAPMQTAERDVVKLLTMRHGTQDFYTHNSNTIRKAVEKTTLVMRVFISSIAVIALVVGGIGVMNIMLVSVTERTAEIGIRMAVGARQRDIQQQFLIEAVLVCLLGGFLGVLLAFAAGTGLRSALKGFTLVFSPSAVVVAVACSSLIGLVFGFWPARNASRLNPVEALARQ